MNPYGPYGSGFPGGQNYQGQQGQQQGGQTGSVHPGSYRGYPGYSGYPSGHPGSYPGYPSGYPATPAYPNGQTPLRQTPQQQTPLGSTVPKPQGISHSPLGTAPSTTLEKKQEKSLKGALKKNKKKLIIVGSVILVIVLALVINAILLASPRTYTVNFNLNGGTLNGSGTHRVQNIPNNTRIPAQQDPMKYGCTFDGWYREQSFVNKWNWETDKVTSDMFLYAKWIGQTITINFDLRGGIVGESDHLQPIDVIFGEVYGNKLPTPTRPGYDFEGWYVGDTRVETFTEVYLASSHTLIAKWKGSEIFVTLDTNTERYFEEAPLKPQISDSVIKVKYRDKYGSLPIPVWPGWEFKEWWTSPIKGQGTQVDASTDVAEMTDQTLYAHWSPWRVEFAEYPSDQNLSNAIFDTDYVGGDFKAASTKDDSTPGHFIYSLDSGGVFPAGFSLEGGDSSIIPRIIGRPRVNATSTPYEIPIAVRHKNHPEDVLSVVRIFNLRVNRKTLQIPTLIPVGTNYTMISAGAGALTPPGSYIAYTYKEGVTHKVEFDGEGQLMYGTGNRLSETETGRLFTYAGVLSSEDSSYYRPFNRFEITLKIANEQNFCWNNPGKSEKEAYLAWIIDRQKIAVPTLQQAADLGSYVYDGKEQRSALSVGSSRLVLERINPNTATESSLYSNTSISANPLYEWTGYGARQQRTVGTYGSTVSILEHLWGNYKWATSTGFPGNEHDSQNISSWSIAQAQLRRPEMRYKQKLVFSAAPDGREEVPASGYIYNGTVREASILFTGKIIHNLADNATLAPSTPNRFNVDERELGAIPKGPTEVGNELTIQPLFFFAAGVNTRSAKDKGTYNFEIQLADKLNYKWADQESVSENAYKPILGSGIDNLRYEWKIQSFQVTAPRSKHQGNSITYGITGLVTDDNKIHVYDGRVKTVDFYNRPVGIKIQNPLTGDFETGDFTDPLYAFVQSADPNINVITSRSQYGKYNNTTDNGGNSGAGIRIELTDPNLEWKGSLDVGSTIVAGILRFNWEIQKAQLQRPILQYGDFGTSLDGQQQNYKLGYVYTGNNRTASFLVTGAPRPNVPDSETNFNLPNPTSTPGKIPTGPIYSSLSYELGTFAADAALFSVVNNNSSTSAVANGVHTAINYGSYSFALVIADPYNYEWAPYANGLDQDYKGMGAETNPSENVTFSWQIRKFKVKAPVVTENILNMVDDNASHTLGRIVPWIYNGRAKNVVLDQVPNYNSIRIWDYASGYEPSQDLYDFVGSAPTGKNAAEDYLVRIKLSDIYNFEWTDLPNTSIADLNGDVLEYPWAIKKYQVAAPVRNVDIMGLVEMGTNAQISYNGKPRHVYFTANSIPTTGTTNTLVLIGGDYKGESGDERPLYGFAGGNARLTETNTGRYSAQLELTDKLNFEWKDLPSDQNIAALEGSNKSGILGFPWIIKGISIQKPTADVQLTGFSNTSNPLVYNGSIFRLGYGAGNNARAEAPMPSSDADIDPTIYTRPAYRYLNDAIPAQINAGQYTVIVELVDKTNYYWASGNPTENLQFTWRIERAEVEAPARASDILRAIRKHASDPVVIAAGGAVNRQMLSLFEYNGYPVYIALDNSKIPNNIPVWDGTTVWDGITTNGYGNAPHFAFVEADENLRAKTDATNSKNKHEFFLKLTDKTNFKWKNFSTDETNTDLAYLSGSSNLWDNVRYEWDIERIKVATPTTVVKNNPSDPYVPIQGIDINVPTGGGKFTGTSQTITGSYTGLMQSVALSIPADHERMLKSSGNYGLMPLYTFANSANDAPNRFDRYTLKTIDAQQNGKTNKIVLTDTTNTEWLGYLGSTEPLELVWQIEKVVVSNPTPTGDLNSVYDGEIKTLTFVQNGETQAANHAALVYIDDQHRELPAFGFKLENQAETRVAFRHLIPHTNGLYSTLDRMAAEAEGFVGTEITVLVSLLDKENFVWATGGSADKRLTWDITKKPVYVPHWNDDPSGIFIIHDNSAIAGAGLAVLEINPEDDLYYFVDLTDNGSFNWSNVTYYGITRLEFAPQAEETLYTIPFVLRLRDPLNYKWETKFPVNFIVITGSTATYADTAAWLVWGAS